MSSFLVKSQVPNSSYQALPTSNLPTPRLPGLNTQAITDARDSLSWCASWESDVGSLKVGESDVGSAWALEVGPWELTGILEACR